MTKIEIIDDTVAFYSADVTRRSIRDDGKCVYKGPEGRECAFQRVVEEDLSRYDEIGFGSSVLSILDARKDLKFKPEYSGHEKDTDFWRHIQRLHDRDANWNETGLSELGERAVVELKRLYTSQ